MYKITKSEMESLLEKMRRIRQESGEIISFIEHLMQLQSEFLLRKSSYNPDDYLERENRHFLSCAEYDCSIETTSGIGNVNVNKLKKDIFNDGTIRNSKKEPHGITEVKRNDDI